MPLPSGDTPEGIVTEEFDAAKVTRNGGMPKLNPNGSSGTTPPSSTPTSNRKAMWAGGLFGGRK